MKNVKEEADNYQRLLKMLAKQFGSKSEFVLHDLTQGYDSTIVAIENNNITGRRIGDCGSNLGLEVLRADEKSLDHDSYGYFTYLKDGRVLRSSTMYIRDDNHEIIGAVCINTDITGFQQLSEFAGEFLGEMEVESESTEEVFARNVGELLDFYIVKCDDLLGLSNKKMTKEDKLAAIRYLDSKGVFLISKAGTRVCKYLKISKGTLYSYLETIRGE